MSSSARKALAIASAMAISSAMACGSDKNPDPAVSLPDDASRPPLVDGGALDAPSEGDEASDDAPIPGDPRPLLLGRSPDCLVCAEAYCSNVLESCSALGGVAKEGPAAGTPKSELCLETMTCFLSKGCSLDAPVQCYCGYESFSESFCVPPGPCQDVFARSLETSDPRAILSAFADPSKAGNGFVSLLMCLRDNRCESCFAAASDGGVEADDGASGIDP